MKKLPVLSILLFMLVFPLYSIERSEPFYDIRVDECYELNGIVWHLVGRETGFVNNGMPRYIASVDSFFTGYKNHPLIEYCRGLSRKHQIAHSAVALAASHTFISDNGVKMEVGYDPEDIAKADSRWTAEAYIRYVELLDSFYRESDFHRFFESQHYTYSEAEKWFNTIIGRKMPDPAWFQTCFGVGPERCTIILGMVNSGNYGSLGGFGKGIGMLFGSCWSYDEKPAFYRHNNSLTVLHEMMHSYVNPIVENYTEEFDSAVSLIYPHVKMKLLWSSYNKEGMMYEGLTRLLTLYAASKMNYDAGQIESKIKSDSLTGFVWMRPALAYLKNFDNDRAAYPTFDKFMPEMVEFMDTVAANLHHHTRVNFGPPTIIRVSPDTNAVYSYADIETFVVEVEFSDDMQYAVGIGLVGEDDKAATKVLLDEAAKNGSEWMYVDFNPWLNLRTMQIRLTKQMLLDSKATGIKILKAYRSGVGVYLENDVILNYNFVE